jgi:2-haloacid dehalogenase
MIGDSITADIKGGNDYGLTTCWLNRKGEKSENYGVTPDYEITSLLELKNIL